MQSSSPAQKTQLGEEHQLDRKSRNPNNMKGTQESQVSQQHQQHEQMRPNSSQNQLQQQARLMSKKSASYEIDSQDEDNAMMLYKSLQGLVKLQALVRGIRARKRVAKLLAAHRKKNGSDLIMKSNLERDISSSIQKHTASNSVLQSISQRSTEQQHVRPASFREKRKYQTNSENSFDGEFLENVRVANPMQDSKDTLSGSNFERMSSRRIELLNRDWRHYFQETELDRAFQRVEIEQQDISEEGTSAGSSSNPSDDNLDQDDLITNVYNANAQKQKQLF